MLVLSRKLLEEIVLTTESGERIIVTVTKINGDKVRLGFTAAPHVKILRSELEECEADNERSR